MNNDQGEEVDRILGTVKEHQVADFHAVQITGPYTGEGATLESLLRRSPLQSGRDYVDKYAIRGDIEYIHSDGSPATRAEWYWAQKRKQPYWDQMALDMAADDRRNGKKIPDWLIRAELDAWLRIREVAA